MAVHIPISVKAPKSVHLQYVVTVLKPNSTEYSTCLLCKNLTEGKKVYNQCIKTASQQDLVTLMLTLNRTYTEQTLSSDVVLCRTIGKVKD